MNGRRGTCACGTKLFSHYAWNRLPREKRAELRAAGYNTAERRGECGPCRQRRVRAETAPAEYGFHWRHEVLEEWELFVDHSMTMGANIRHLAPRLGMTPRALEKALRRSGVKAWPVDALGWAERAS